MYFNKIKNEELDFIKETKLYVKEYMIEDNDTLINPTVEFSFKRNKSLN